MKGRRSPVAEIHCDDTTLTVEIQGLHKVWAVKNRLEIPLANVEGITRDPSIAFPGWKALKLPGTHIPGVFTAGTFRIDGEWVFWDVRHLEHAVVIDLRDEHYARLVVEVAEPEETVARVGRCLNAGVPDGVAV
jgi:hypothetical protein